MERFRTILLISLACIGQSHAKPIYLGTILGAPNDRLQKPWDVVVNSDRQITIADYGTNGVKTFDGDTFLPTVHFPLPQPRGIAILRDGKLLVASEMDTKVHQYNDNTGVGTAEILKSGGVEELFPEVQDIAVMLGTVPADDKILVSDKTGNQIFQYDNLNGDNKTVISSPGATGLTGTATAGSFKITGSTAQNVKIYTDINTLASTVPMTGSPFGIMEGDLGYTAIGFNTDHQVKIFDDACTTLQSTTGTPGIAGTGHYQFNSPQGIYFKNGQLMVADTGNNRVQVFFDPTMWKVQDTVRLSSLPLGDQNLTLEDGFILNVTNTLSLSSTLKLKGRSLLIAGLLQLENGSIEEEGIHTFGATELVGNNVITVADFQLATFSDRVGGSGKITKRGLGELAFSGVLEKNFGGLAIDEGLVSFADRDVTLTSLSGIGRVTATGCTLVNAGQTAVGNPGDQLTVDGNYVLQPTSTFMVTLKPSAAPTPADASLLKIEGGNHAVTLAGSLILQPEPGDYHNGASYTFLDAGTVNGNFSAYSRFVGPYEVILDPSQKSFSLKKITLSALNEQNFTSNEKGWSDYLTSLGTPATGSDLGNVIGTLGTLDASKRAQALDSISPETLNTATINAEQNGVSINEISATRLSSFRESGVLGAEKTQPNTFRMDQGNRWLRFFKPNANRGHTTTNSRIALGANPDKNRLTVLNSKDKQFTVWLEGFDQTSIQRAYKKMTGFNAKSGGVVVGMDQALGQQALVGIGVGKADSRIRLKADLAKNTVDQKFALIYGTWFKKGWYVDGSVVAGRTRYKTEERIALGASNRIRSGEHQGVGITPHLGVGYTFQIGALEWKPSLSADYLVNREKAYRTQGAQALNVTVGARTSKAIRGKTGLVVARGVDFAYGQIKPMAGLHYVYKKTYKGRIQSGLVGQPASLQLESPGNSMHQWTPGIGVLVNFNQDIALEVQAGSEQGSGYHSYSGNLALSAKF